MRMWVLSAASNSRDDAQRGPNTRGSDGSAVASQDSRLRAIHPHRSLASLELCLERFTDQYEAFPRSRSAVNRRVTAAAEAADIEGRVYPHALRATAASYHAYQGVAPVPLQALMGWNDLATAQKYIRISGRATADVLRQVHHR
jgi:integrase